jgi:glycosyltransferase involved in cell wall biosynthesis
MTATLIDPLPLPTAAGLASAAGELTAWRPARGSHGAPVVDIVVPVYNEEAQLAASVTALHAYLGEQLPFPFRITIADNASTDSTWEIATELHSRLEGVAALRLRSKGRGRALRTAWAWSDAEVLAYMDVDLSTDLAAVLPLVAPLVSGHSDVAIGTRLQRSSRVVRGPKREFISRCYNMLLHSMLRAKFSDAQLLVLAERSGLRIHEVPVDWIDDADSRVDVVDTAMKDLRGVGRIRWELMRRSLPLGEIRSQLGRRRQNGPGIPPVEPPRDFPVPRPAA